MLRRRTLVMFGLGFGSGLPFLLLFDTLSAWLHDAGVPLKVISTFVLATYLYIFKFLWAPLIDHVSPPGLARWLGRRRAWMLIAQIGAAAGLFAVSAADPAHNLAYVWIAVLFTGFCGATQDISMDAWRIEVAEVDAQGAMAAAYTWGYRLAMIASGVIPLVLAERRGWHVAYAVMSALMVVGVGSTLLAPKPAAEPGDDAGASRRARSWPAHLSEAVIEPFVDFFRRFGGWGALILALICFYRLSDFSLTVMNPFYLDLGFSKTEVAEVRKVFGVIMTMVGVLGGAWAIARFGILRCLVAGAILAPSTHLVYAWLATQGPSREAFMAALALDNLSEGFSGTCLVAYMSSLTTQGSTATQYALLSSAYGILGKSLGAFSGTIIDRIAHAAGPGGPLAGWTAMFTRLPHQSFAAAGAKMHLPASAVATGYAGFFIYAFMLGWAGIALSILVAWLKPGDRTAVAPATADA